MKEIDFASTIIKKKIATIGIVTANPAEGNTTTTAKMAAALKLYANKGVLAVDMSGGGAKSLSAIARASRKMQTGIGKKLFCETVHGEILSCAGFSILAPFPEEINEIKLDKRKTEDWLSALSSSFDFVLFDLPSFNQNPEYVIFMQSLAGVALTLNCVKSRWEVAVNMKEHLEEAGVNIIGAVLNQRKFPIPSAVYSWL